MNSQLLHDIICKRVHNSIQNYTSDRTQVRVSAILNQHLAEEWLCDRLVRDDHVFSQVKSTRVILGRPSEMNSKWRVGKWVESSCSWVMRQWLCSVFRKVTWRPEWQRSCAILSMGLMWPSKGKGNISIWGCCCWWPILKAPKENMMQLFANWIKDQQG